MPSHLISAVSGEDSISGSSSIGMGAVRVEIYRIKGSADGWSLEVVDHNGTSTVWDDLFPTDRDAYAEFEQTLASDGIRSFSADSPPRSVH
jgi:hypothetical protein